MKRKIYWLAVGSLAVGCAGEAPPPQAAADSAGPVAEVFANAEPAVVFLGTSLTAGWGVDPDSAFPALIQGKIDSLGWSMRVVNGGVSGETSAGGLRRLPWLLDQPIVAALVLELGANDGLRGLSIDHLAANLDSIVKLTADRHPRAVIAVAGMQAPPDLGPRYTAAFAKMFGDIAARHGLALVPFLLEGVAGVSSLNQEDGIHPTAAGHRIMAENVWRILEPALRRVAG